MLQRTNHTQSQPSEPIFQARVAVLSPIKKGKAETHLVERLPPPESNLSVLFPFVGAYPSLNLLTKSITRFVILSKSNRVNRADSVPAIKGEIQRRRRNEILAWSTRWLQHARQKETTNHSPCDRGVDCLHRLAGNHALSAQFGRKKGAPVETSSNQSSGDQRIEL